MTQAPPPSSPAKTCSIHAKRLPLALASHMYLDVFDENGQRIAQINGYAVNLTTGGPKAVGIPGDGLRAFVGMDAVLGMTWSSTRDNHRHKGGAIFEGARAEVDALVKAMQQRAHEINAHKLPYLITALNSNTVFAQMVDALRAQVKIDEAALKSTCGLWIAPGLSCDFKSAVARYGAQQAPAAPQKPKPPQP